MGFFFRAVITGFGYSMGKEMFDRIKEQVAGKSDKPEANRVEIVNIEELREEIRRAIRSESSQD